MTRFVRERDVRSVGLAAAIAVAALVAPAAIPFAQDPLQMAVGEELVLEQLGLLVRFEAVTEDSRCPVDENVDCVWEGNARALFSVTTELGEGVPYAVALNTASADAYPSEVILPIGLAFILVGLAPDRTFGDRQPLDYVAQLLVREVEG